MCGPRYVFFLKIWSKEAKTLDTPILHHFMQQIIIKSTIFGNHKTYIYRYTSKLDTKLFWSIYYKFQSIRIRIYF